MFKTEARGLVSCSGGDYKDEKLVFKEFYKQYGDAIREMSDEAKLLFKVTVEEDKLAAGKAKPMLYVGVPHTAPFSEVLELFNAKFNQKHEGQKGAFILDGGFAVNTTKNAGNVFMKYGLELNFHTKVDFSRLAYA